VTIPPERFNAIRNTREFLRSLLDPKKTPRVPKTVRREAYWCLRHFPGELDMEYTARKVPGVWGEAPKRPSSGAGSK
jgi:hypothetical protein